MKNLFLAASIIALSTNCYAIIGKGAGKPKKTRISSVSVLSGGASLQSSTANSLSTFKKLMPSSTLLSLPITQSNYYNNKIFTTNNSLLVGLDIGGNRRAFRNMELRFGLYTSSVEFNYHADESASYRIDTLTSNNTGDQYYIDSYRTKSLNASFMPKMLGGDVALLFKSNTGRKFNFYGGIGMNYASSINTQATVNYYEYSNINSPIHNMNYYNNVMQNDSFKVENISSNIKSTMTNWYIPLGISYQLSKKNYLLKHAVVFIESRPSLSVINNKEVGLKNKDITYNTCIGFKVKF